MKRYIARFSRAWVLCILSVFLMAGCATSGPNFSRSLHVSDTFEGGQLLKDHQYYLFGHPHSPDALVAVRNGYRLVSPKWQPVSLDNRQIKDWVETMASYPGAEYNAFPNGADILNDQGEVIGAWYSVWQLPVLTFKDETAFALSDPVAEFPGDNRDSTMSRFGLHPRAD